MRRHTCTQEMRKITSAEQINGACDSMKRVKQIGPDRRPDCMNVEAPHARNDHGPHTCSSKFRQDQLVILLENILFKSTWFCRRGRWDSTVLIFYISYETCLCAELENCDCQYATPDSKPTEAGRCELTMCSNVSSFYTCTIFAMLGKVCRGLFRLVKSCPPSYIIVYWSFWICPCLHLCVCVCGVSSRK